MRKLGKKYFYCSVVFAFASLIGFVAARVLKLKLIYGNYNILLHISTEYVFIILLWAFFFTTYQLSLKIYKSIFKNFYKNTAFIFILFFFNMIIYEFLVSFFWP